MVQAGKQLQVVIAEDEEHTIRALEYILRKEGYSVQSVMDGKSALEILQGSPEGEPGLLITDIEMPGMTGVELLENLRLQHKSVPTLVITGYGDKKLVQQLLRIGCDDFLDKPFTREEVMESIQRVLDKESDRKLEKEVMLNSQTREISRAMEQYKERVNALQGEIQSARTAHSSIVGVPQPKFIPFSAAIKPLGTLGGDFIELLEEEDRATIILADVSGHDMGASYHTILLKTACENLRNTSSSPSEVLSFLNRMLLESNSPARMICAQVICLDFHTRTGQIASSAIPECLCLSRHNMSCYLPEYTGPALGVDPTVLYKETSFKLLPGDRFVMCTDGILDAYHIHGPSGRKNRLGKEGLEKLSRETRSLSPRDAADEIVQRTLSYTKYKQSDDYLVAVIDVPEDR